MKKRLLGISAIIVAALFLLTPISAMSAISTVDEKPARSIIPQSEFMITLGENEKVTWIADFVTRDDDIAYVTVETNVEADELEGELRTVPNQPPQPLGWTLYSYYVTVAWNWWGRPLFWTKASGFFKFSIYLKCYDVIGTSSCASWCLRYTRLGLDEETYPHPPWPDDYGTVSAHGHFRDNVIRRYPTAHAFIIYPYLGLPSGSGGIDWD